MTRAATRRLATLRVFGLAIGLAIGDAAADAG